MKNRDYGYSNNNYTNHITFKRANSNPRYMQVLEDLVLNGPATRAIVVASVWCEDLAKHSNGWNCGPFTLLRDNGLVKYDASTRMWSATAKGKRFYCKVNNLKH